MRVRLLGTAAGGGLPQWNCACPACRRARDAGAARTQDCVAVSGDERSWYLLNASPDIRSQLLAAPELAPGPGRRQTPVRGVLFCTAELDHTLGLLALREAERLTVYGPAAVLDALAGPFPARQIVGAYTSLEWTVIVPGEPVELPGGLTATAIPVGAKRPRYTAGSPLAARSGDWVVAYRISDPATGGTLVYAPCLPAVDEAFLAAVAGADVLLVDGSFLHDDEMTRATGGGRTATEMGHLPVTVSLPGLAPAVAAGARVRYTHLNNTNPLCDPEAPERKTLADHGAGVAEDGETFTL